LKKKTIANKKAIIATPSAKRSKAGKSAADKTEINKTHAGSREKANQDRETELSPAEKKSFPIVGIGASAGGLEAIKELLSNMPRSINAAFIIVQHLTPTGKSITGSFLQKHTAMRVLEMENRLKVEPNTVYLNPPGKEVSIQNGVILLEQPREAHAARLPIDHFFRSLAADQGDRAICVVLSGIGSDGTLGLKEIKGAGGLTIAQVETQAKFESMQRSVIDTGLLGLVLPVESIAAELAKYTEHSYITKEGVAPVGKEYELALSKIFVMIRSKTGHDFSNYKTSTTRRRIERRMAVQQIDKINEYCAFLANNPEEVDALYKDMLIGVTNFFRNQEAFNILRQKIAPDILKTMNKEDVVRIWTPGCSTGEEAYSLAMLFLEAAEESNKRLSLQIFATDVDTESLNFARAAVYPKSISADVSASRLKRFFTKENDSYRIKNNVRESIVFAKQNVFKDPPFSRLDMVSCRNMLIYMEPELQNKIISMFHYTLKKDAVLFIGASESIGEHNELFQPLDGKWKIYKRVGQEKEKATRRAILPFLSDDDHAVPANFKVNVLCDDVKRVAEKAILNSYSPPCVLINERLEILYFHGLLGKYLSPPIGEARFNVLEMVKVDLRFKISLAIQKAIKTRRNVTEQGVLMSDDGSARVLDLAVHPLNKRQTGNDGLYMVIFKEKRFQGKILALKKKRWEGSNIDPRVTTLEQELKIAKEYLQSVTEELETSNEELQSTNEEMQSANEELETSKEELQSSNEELAVTNSELLRKVDQLSQVNNDLNNLLASTEIATIFLDGDLCVTRFTPSVVDIFNLKKGDIGRPISDITFNLVYDALYEDAFHTLKTLEKKRKAVRTKQGRWMDVRIIPYRTTDHVIDGLVITFMDITEMKNTEIALLEKEKNTQTILSIANDGIFQMDKLGKITSSNKIFSEMIGYAEKDLIGRRIVDFVAVRDSEIKNDTLEKLLSGEPVKRIIPFVHKDEHKIRAFLMSGSIIVNGEVSRIIGIVRDVIERATDKEIQ